METTKNEAINWQGVPATQSYVHN